MALLALIEATTLESRVHTYVSVVAVDAVLVAVYFKINF